MRGDSDGAVVYGYYYSMEGGLVSSSRQGFGGWFDGSAVSCYCCCTGARGGASSRAQDTDSGVEVPFSSREVVEKGDGRWEDGGGATHSNDLVSDRKDQ